jgi:Rod binding protein
MSGPVRDKSEPFQQLESILLRQMLQSSGAFKAGSTPGAQLRTDMFVETLADAVAKAGGLGIARMLERQLGGGAGSAPDGGGASGAAARAPASGPLRGASSHLVAGRLAMPASSQAPALDLHPRSPTSPDLGVSDPDRLEDPNNDAPLPEDPTADSIDAYQPGPSALHALSRGRGLNGYRRRAEDKVAGTSFGVSSGEEP